MSNKRMELGEELWRLLTNFAMDSTHPTYLEMKCIVDEEILLWERTPLWPRLSRSSTPVEIYGNQVVPMPEGMLRGEENSKLTYIGDDIVMQFQSSGTTNSVPGVAFVDAIGAALYSVAIISCISPIVRELGYGSLCKSWNFGTFGSAVETFQRNAHSPLLVPLTDIEPPFQLAISCFPGSRGTAGYDSFPTEKSFVSYGTEQYGRLLAKSTAYPVEIRRIERDGKQVVIPYSPKMGEIDALVENTCKPIFWEAPSPVVPMLVTKMRPGDFMWGAGGDKSGRGIPSPSAMADAHEKRLVNLLGDTHRPFQRFSPIVGANALFPDDPEHKNWMFFCNREPFSRVIAYDNVNGSLPDHMEGRTAYFDPVRGICSLGLLVLGDRIQTEPNGFHLYGR